MISRADNIPRSPDPVVRTKHGVLRLIRSPFLNNKPFISSGTPDWYRQVRYRTGKKKHIQKLVRNDTPNIMGRCDWGRRPAGPVQQVAEKGIVAPSGLRGSSGAEHQRCRIGLVVFFVY